MSAGADEPALAASRVSVVSSVGYCAFLAGPPLIGFLGSRTTVLEGLTAVLVLLVLAVGDRRRRAAAPGYVNSVTKPAMTNAPAHSHSVFSHAWRRIATPSFS